MQIIEKYTVILLYLVFATPLLKADDTRNHAETIPDSLVNEKYITRIYLSEPKRALNLLDEAARRHLPGMEPFRINLLRSMVYESQNMYTLKEQYIRRALTSDSILLVPHRHLRALSQLAMALVQNNKYEEGIRIAHQGIDLARKLGQADSESGLLSLIGQMYLGMFRTDEGIEHMKQAIHLLEGTKNVHEMAQMSTTCGDLIAILTEHGRLHEAINTGLQRAEIIRNMSEMPGPPPGYIDQQYGFLYSKMAYTYLMNGQAEEAEDAFNKYLATNYARTPQGQGEGIPYLLKKQRYREAINANRKLQNIFQGQDTVSYRYLVVLNQYAEAYRGLRQYALADTYQLRTTTLTDSIYKREKAGHAHELVALFDTKEKEAQIAEQGYQLNLQRTLTGSVSLILILSLTFLWINYRHLCKIRGKNRIIEEKNRAASRQINELLAQREQLRRTWQEELEKEEQKEQEAENNEEETPSASNRQDRHIFQKMENTLLSEQVYLNPDYRRENLMELTHLNKNRLTDIIKECTGTTPNTYINHLRIEHAVHLMKTYPHYSIESIATDSGFNSKNTFYTAFREVFGMTPNEYKKEEESKAVTVIQT